MIGQTFRPALACQNVVIMLHIEKNRPTTLKPSEGCNEGVESSHFLLNQIWQPQLADLAMGKAKDVWYYLSGLKLYLQLQEFLELLSLVFISERHVPRFT